jgi:hypothetical protein
MKNRWSIVLLLLAVIITEANVAAQSPGGKNSLKVLFVGYDPSKPMPESKRYYPGMMSKELFTAEYPVRMPAFKQLLSAYFSEVKTMDCRDWKPADSDPYDVTIFDFKTKPLPDTAKGKPAKYLPDNFSKPVIFISSTASEMGSSIGLKLDWLCLCLDADAHHFNAKHAIFQGPLEKVTPTTAMKKTPEGIFHYTTGHDMPKELPMWRVQTVGYIEGSDQCRIGLVSRGSRFTEGPDAEVISSGVCQKDVGAVALGRHGNFFLWGFGASPAQMTEEAKKVFVNTVVYMKQFNGKPPITRKYNERMGTTDDMRETAAFVSKESYESYKKGIGEFNEANAKQKKKLDEKKAAGQELTSLEQESLSYIGRSQPIETYEEFLKGRMGKFAARFGSDAVAFQQYIKNNFDYLYCNPTGFYEFSVDEEVQQIGVSNHSVQLLDTCVQMLKRNDRAGLALTVLKRYTGESFTAANEWSNWLAKFRSKLYFSETDGYRFKINTYN